jgi:hypothetical protein
VAQKASLPVGPTTITGCLKGKTELFYLVEKDGTTRLLRGPDERLMSDVGYWVELGGTAMCVATRAPAAMKGLPTGCGSSRSRRSWLTREAASTDP